MKQLTTQEAIALAERGDWKQWTPQQRAMFQMVQECLCMPFGEFHQAIQTTLGRPVYTHEFGSAGRIGLMQELAGLKSAPTLDEIIALIPADLDLTVVSP